MSRWILNIRPDEGIITLILWENTFGLTPAELDELVSALTEAQAEVHWLIRVAAPDD